MRSGKTLLVVVVVVVVIAVGAVITIMRVSATSTGPRPLTTAEAERLAAARSLHVEGRGVHFTTSFDAREGPVELDGVLDLRADVGTAGASVGGASETVQWDADTMLRWPGAGVDASTPSGIPGTDAVSRRLDPSASLIDLMLCLLSSLGADRSDDARLLQQSGARWLRTDEIGGTAVDVIAGPSSGGDAMDAGRTRYWIDDTGHLLRFEAELAGGWVTVHLDANAFRAIEPSPQLDPEG